MSCVIATRLYQYLYMMSFNTHTFTYAYKCHSMAHLMVANPSYPNPSQPTLIMNCITITWANLSCIYILFMFMSLLSHRKNKYYWVVNRQMRVTFIDIVWTTCQHSHCFTRYYFMWLNFALLIYSFHEAYNFTIHDHFLWIRFNTSLQNFLKLLLGIWF